MSDLNTRIVKFTIHIPGQDVYSSQTVIVADEARSMLAAFKAGEVWSGVMSGLDFRRGTRGAHILAVTCV
jgi:hypothetical protein